MKIAKKILNWLLFLSIFLAFHFYAGQYDFRRAPGKVDRAKNLDSLLHQGPYDIVFVGTSHMYYGISPIVVNKLLPETVSVSLALYPASMLEAYPYIKSLVRSENPPRVIVLDAYYFAQSEEQLNWRFYPQHNGDLLPAVYSNLSPETHLEWYFPFLTSHNIWKDWPLLSGYLLRIRTDPSEPAVLNETLHLSAEYYYDDTVMLPGEFEQSKQAGLHSLNDNREWELRLFQELCNRYGVELLMVNIPAANQWGLHYPGIEETMMLFDTIPYIDYNLTIPAEQEFGSIIFMGRDDPAKTKNGHLNNMGVLLTSIHLAEDLSALYGYSINENAISQYKEVLLADLVVHGLIEDGVPQEGEEFLRFEVIPLLEDTPVQYQWQLFDDTQLVIFQELSNENTFLLPAEYWGEVDFRLQLLLNHPVLDDHPMPLTIELSEMVP